MLKATSTNKTISYIETLEMYEANAIRIDASEERNSGMFERRKTNVRNILAASRYDNAKLKKNPFIDWEVNASYITVNTTMISQQDERQLDINETYTPCTG